MHQDPSLSREDKLFLSRIADAERICSDRGIPKFTAFLDEHQLSLLLPMLSRMPGAQLFGGYEDAERRVLGFFPDWMEPVPEEFPISAINISWRKSATLSHRDILGALMSRKITRESVGDILIAEGEGSVFVLSHLAEQICRELDQIGREGVHAEVGTPKLSLLEPKFEERSGVIASERLDCAVAFLCSKSRSGAVCLIEGGLVSVNSVVVCDCDVRLKSGDKISVRGCGKFILDTLGPQTKKGRLSIRIKKYI